MAHTGPCVKRWARNLWPTSVNLRQPGHLAPVPRSGRPQPTLAEQLKAALAEKPVISQRELGRRLAALDDTDPEVRRRWVRKILDGEVRRPEPESLRLLERALKKKPGHFKLPDREPRAAKEAREANFERRLADLEAGLTALTEELRLELPKIARRVQALERQARTKTVPKAKRQGAR